MEEVMTPPPDAPLRRRNSIATSVLVPTKLNPTKLHHHPPSILPTRSTSSSQACPTVDFELISIEPFSYTSLKDLLPDTAVQSPTSAGAPGAGLQSGYEILIRNRLVKQAAWAYLQPMSTSPDSSGQGFLHRLWVRFSGALSKNPVAALLRFVGCGIIRALNRTVDRLLRAIGMRSPR